MILGVGYGRTGTESLQKALEILGYTTFHTKTMMLERPELLELWHRNVSQQQQQSRFIPPSSSDTYGEQQQELVKLDFCPFDLDVFLEGYSAATGMILAVCWEKALELYPDALFILTTRTSPEEWFQSWSTLMESISMIPQLAPWLGRVVPRVKYMDDYHRWLLEWIFRPSRTTMDSCEADGSDYSSYWTRPYPLVQNSAQAQQSYLDHIENIRRSIPPDRLLEIEVGRNVGWKPLVTFLSVTAPQRIPYPHLNTSQRVVWTCRCVVVLSNVFLLVCLYITTKILTRWTRVAHKKLPIDTDGDKEDKEENDISTGGDKDDSDDDDDYLPTVRILPESNQRDTIELTTVTTANEPKYLLSLPMMQQLARDALPPIVALRCWQRVYQLSRDGDDFGTFHKTTEGHKQTLLVVQTTRGKLFGAFADSLWDASERDNYSISVGAGFYGSTQACLFTFEKLHKNRDAEPATDALEKPQVPEIDVDKEPKVSVFKWSGRNRYIQLLDIHKGRVALGGGGTDKEGLPGFGLCLEDNFARGTSAPNDTFGNEFPLTGDSEGFSILDIEVWTFPHGTLG